MRNFSTDYNISSIFTTVKKNEYNRKIIGHFKYNFIKFDEQKYSFCVKYGFKWSIYSTRKTNHINFNDADNSTTRKYDNK